MNLNTEICKSFNQHAADYDQASKFQQEVGLRLFERLDYLKISPRYVLDLGCGTGLFSPLLKKRYPNAQIIGLDIAYAMLQQAKKKQGWRKKWPLVNADMMALPFADGFFDLIFANQVIHWSPLMPDLMRALYKVLNSQGCLMFSTLGPDTFKELRQSWSQADNHAHTNHFMDMHDVGDVLLHAHFLDPVMDMEWLRVHYPSLPRLLQSLKAQGVRNVNPGRNKGLTGKSSLQAFEKAFQAFCTAEGKYPLTYEVVYGHAWKGEPRQVEENGEVFIPISSIIRADRK